MTSWRLCHELVASGVHAGVRIVVVGQEPHPAYDRVRLTSLLAGASVDDLLLAERGWYESVGIELHLGETVTEIDRKNRFVRAGARTLGYDRLILATGSVPFVPPVLDAKRPGVFVYRTVADILAIRLYGSGRRKAVVIGGGLLGLEAAKAVYDLGLEVSVVESFPTLMPRQLDAEGGERLASRIAKLGVCILTGKVISALDSDGADGDEHVVRFAGGGSVRADLVVVAAGIRPATALARSAGLEIGRNGGGVVVDERLRTSDERIFAIGECASRAGATFGLVAPGYQMARVLVANLTGELRTFAASTTAAKLKLLGVDVCSIGETADDAPDTQATRYRSADSYRKVVVRAGRMVGALAVGEWSGFDRVAQAVQMGDRVSDTKLRRFRRDGELWPPPPSAAALPEASIVCSCMQVTRGQIEAARLAGCADVAAVCRETTAATMCGSCRPLVQELVELLPASIAPRPSREPQVFPLGTPPRGSILPAPRPERGARLLVALAAAALLATGLVVARATVPALLAVGALDFAIPVRTLRLWTGYGALALSALALLLPLRKRWRRFAVGSVATWRLVHGLLGATTIAVIAVHTSLHLGSHLNQALMIDYLGVIVVGAVAGVAYGMSDRLNPVAARGQRRFWTRVHVVVLWPLPVLAAFHILAAYFY